MMEDTQFYQQFNQHWQKAKYNKSFQQYYKPGCPTRNLYPRF
jgi:hypothetical protein